ncbi:unnamed protein product, partial [Rotaria magnacalcarata]
KKCSNQNLLVFQIHHRNQMMMKMNNKRNKDDAKKSEVRLNTTSNSSPTQTTSPVPSRTGGLYIPPATLRLLDTSSVDKSSVEYQRTQWDALERNINLLVDQANESNICPIINELFKQNIVRGCGLFVRSIIRAQSTTLVRASVCAALVSIINPWIEIIGELIVKQVISSFRRQYKSNDKTKCLSTTKFIAHLVNQNVLHEIITLEILILLLGSPSDDNVELAIEFVKECGQKLCEVSPRGLNSIFSKLENLHNKPLKKCTRDMIEDLVAVREGQFKENPAVPRGLDLVHKNIQYTHMITLDTCEPQPILDLFTYDEKYEEHEEQYNVIRAMFFRKSSDDEDKSNFSISNDKGDGNKDNVDDEKKEKQETIIDDRETNLLILRRAMCLEIESSVDHEMKLCQVIVNICAEQQTYEDFFGLLGQRICTLKKEYVKYFEKVFQDQYEIVHGLENVKLRNVAKFFAHLLFTKSISWDVLNCCNLTKDTKLSECIYFKYLLLEIVEFLDKLSF